MSLPNINIPPFDPNLFTGPTRLITGTGRTGDVVLDTEYEFATRLYVGTTGDVSYVKWDGTTQVLMGLLGGIWHNILSKSVNTTGTTATDIVWGS